MGCQFVIARPLPRTVKLVAGERVAALGGGNLVLVLAIGKCGGGTVGLLRRGCGGWRCVLAMEAAGSGE